MPRLAIKDFQLGNPMYKGAAVTFYTVAAGVKTANKATLYQRTTGADVLANPQKLDGHGKFKQACYIDVPVIGTIEGITVPTHDTGIISPAPTFRVAADGEVQYSFDGGVTWESSGDFFFRNRAAWASATSYERNDYVTFGGDTYIALSDHVSTASFATDLASSKWRLMVGSREIYFEDFGAVGDGVADDTAAMQSAINSVSSNTTIRGKPGATYKIGAAGLVLTSKTRLHLVGGGAIISAATLATPTGLIGGRCAIKFDTCVECSISGFVLDGTGLAHDLVSLNTCTECTVENNLVKSGGVNGMLVSYGSTRTAVRNNVIQDLRDSVGGVRLGHYGADNQIDYEGIIHGNRIDCTGSSFSDGIILGCLQGGSVTGNIQKNGFSGIIFSGHDGRTTKSVTVSGNRFTGNSGHGIQWDIVQNLIGTYPVGMMVVGNICDANTSSGIYALHANGATINGNSCYNNGVNGITLDEVHNIVVSGNYLTDTRAGGSRTQITGIELIAAVNATGNTNIAITGNVATNHTQRGIDIETVSAGDSVDNITVCGNVCTGNSGYGILIAEASPNTVNAATVVGNTCTGNGTSDIRLDPPNMVIYGNKYDTWVGGTRGNGYIDFAALDTTPSVKGGGNGKFRTQNGGGATTITNFDDGVDGQEISVLAGDVNTTIQHNTIRLNGGANFVMGQNNTITLRFHVANWYEIARGTAT